MSILIHISGPPTAGKSTTTALLQKTMDGHLTIVDFDTIKREIPDYDWRVHGQVGRAMTVERFALAAETRQPILLLYPRPKTEEEYNRIVSIAEANDYEIHSFELTAPDDVLIERYAYRLDHIDPAKKHWKFKTLDEFKLHLKEPHFRPTETITFDSSKLTPDKITQGIISCLATSDLYAR